MPKRLPVHEESQRNKAMEMHAKKIELIDYTDNDHDHQHTEWFLWASETRSHNECLNQ